MLDRHTNLAMTPETAFYDEIAPGMRKRGHARSLLQEWPRLPELGLSVDAVVERSGQDPTPAHLLRTLLQLYAETRGKPCCGEKTPQHLRHAPTLMRDFPNARVVCMIRDGRDVVLSLQAMPWWSAGLRTSVNAYLKAIALSDSFAANYPGRFLAVHYEHLVDRPVQALSAVMNFLGLEFEPGQLEPGPSDVVLARSMPWKGAALGDVEPGLSDHRRSHATTKDLKYLERRLGPTLRRLGYEID
jgi:hypothetical protein